jgi:hypothetical protein
MSTVIYAASACAFLQSEQEISPTSTSWGVIDLQHTPAGLFDRLCTSGPLVAHSRLSGHRSLVRVHVQGSLHPSQSSSHGHARLRHGE